MSKFIVTVFDDEKAAYKGSQALVDLHAEGSIVLYSAAVISKDSQGAVQVEDAGDEGPVGTVTGMLVGSLIGALGGPVGMLAGAAGGSLGGWLADLYNVGVDGQFLDDVGGVLAPGKCAVVGEITEGWTTPLDTRMEELGGITFRRSRIDVEDQQIERDIEATNRELDELDAELQQASDDAKAKLQTKVDAAKAKLQSLHDKAEKKVTSIKSEADAKLAKLNEQIAKAQGDAKAKFEKARDDLKSEYDQRSAKLKQASKLTAEA